MTFLLDTCTFLWLALEPERLSMAATHAINDPAGGLFLSDVGITSVQNHELYTHYSEDRYLGGAILWALHFTDG